MRQLPHATVGVGAPYDSSLQDLDGKPIYNLYSHGYIRNAFKMREKISVKIEKIGVRVPII